MIPVYKPWLTPLEKKYVNEAIDSKWISSTGKFVEKAEELFADLIGVKHCLVTTSGTTALHLCFRALDLPHYSGDTRENIHGAGMVIIPNTTFVASAFAASYDQRDIQLIDIDPETWNMDLDLLEKWLKVGKAIDAVMPVHLYGNPVDMERLLQLQKRYKFKIIEDACESLGAHIDGKLTGSWGDMACFSFYGNKTFSCGEGGAITTNNSELALRAKILRGQAQDSYKRYWHIDVGYNYRMTNVQAAILCGQLERHQEILNEKQRVTDRYLSKLKQHFEFQKVLPNHHHSNWLITLKLPKKNSKVSNEMRSTYEVDTRKVFYPISDMPPYHRHYTGEESAKLSDYGLSLPSYPELSNAEIDYICDSLIKVCDAK